MKKVYEMPKAVKHNFEAKDIITSSNSKMLGFSKTGDVNNITSIDWAAWGNED